MGLCKRYPYKIVFSRCFQKIFKCWLNRVYMMSNTILLWLRKPEKLNASFVALFPIIASQILQRLYPIIDNRYLAILGDKALYIHTIQYNFISFGQFIGIATYISCLVFWRRNECLNKQGSVLINHLILAGIFTSALAVIGWIFAEKILIYYRVDDTYLSLSVFYLKIGLCNMVLQALYGGLDGMLVGSKLQHKSMLIAFVLVISNMIIDSNVINSHYFTGRSSASLILPMMVVGVSTTILLLIACVVALILIIRRVQGWERFHLREMIIVWWGELGSYLIRGTVPFIYSYQLCFINATAGFLVTYQLALHLSYIFCYPLIAAMQIAIRDACETESMRSTRHDIPRWWNTFLYTGMIPSTILIALGVVVSVPMMRVVYGYITPIDHVPFLILFFIGCWIGQWGNVFTIPLRAAKKSYLVTKNFFIAELIVMLAGTQLLIYMNAATPFSLGCVTLMFTFAYGFSNFRDAITLNKDQNLRLAYEKSN